MAERKNRRWLRGPKLVVGGVAVLLVAGAAVAWASTQPSSPSYRSVAAAPATVTDTLQATGTIQPVSQATVGFPVAGQVASVAVAVGQKVTAGQLLAQLNTTTLAGQVSSAQSTVATAQAKLATDQNSQTTVASTAPKSSSSSALSTMVKGLGDSQDAVRKAQQQVDADLTLVSAAVKQSKASCPTVVSALGDQHAPPEQSQVNDCSALLQQVLDAQTKTATDERALADAETKLSQALGKAVSAVNTPASTSSGNAGRSGGQSQGPASAEQIAADQASLDAASAQLAAARQNLAAADLVSPIDGTVAQVSLVAGQSSAQAHVVVLGAGASQVTTAVNDTQVGKVKPGQQASITPDGASSPIRGKVTSVGALSSTTSGGAPSYPVTISLEGTGQSLFAGATATVSITLGSAQAAVAVPTSAVHSVGGFSFVTKLVDGQTGQVRVTLGVTGSALTQVTGGLQAGDQVVLADLGQELPTATSNRGLTGGGARGGFGGGGGTGGGGRTGGPTR
ncbi:hypothetical protein GCM10010174_52980 [Kutzneria viridogrisea]|uniref:HlyD family secretion protein n=1 Tax=Kutzneria viridogrisea TaxID=47990 RepID=A0ABR6BXL4_9PSEU|nr:HlyD family efflux transporter periplasmic adaptor subunit [Kutzneria albida]MBA8931654.1 HlyD family secretion protein [Kutzneria viridogrisea]